MSYLELLRTVMPETILAVAAMVVLGLDVLVIREDPLRNRFWICGAFAVVGCIIAAGWMIVMNIPAAAPAFLSAGVFADDSLTRFLKLALLALTVCTIVLSCDADFTTHVGEYVALILLATIGMMLLVSATNLLMIFISLELTSLSLYILTAFNKRSVSSAEAALKYYLFGGMSAAFTLFGLSLIYGLSGSIQLNEIGASLGGANAKLDPLLLVAIVMTVIGFGFKIAAVPFHLWAPDAYQGAPTPSAALIASGSKVASFFIFAKVMFVAFGPAAGNGAWRHFATGWLPVIAVIAAASMILGNLTAIMQTNVKRLLAYSAIAHAGYALLGLMAVGQTGLGALIYYIVTYGVTVVGAFGVVSVIEKKTGSARLQDFAGLSRREPVLAFCMMIFMLSLAGIPPLAGFFGKFYLFSAAVGGAKNLGLLWLVVVAIATSAISLYYYLQVLKQIYVVPAGEASSPARASISTQFMLALMALAVIVFGCAPGLLLDRLLPAIQAAGL